MFFGFRLAEFLQLQINIHIKHIPRNRDGIPQDFILSDITIYGPHKTVLCLNYRHPVNPSSVVGFAIRWRYQKNMQNGEVKLMVRNDRNPALCTVRALLRICYRAAALSNPPDQPLMIYQSTSSKTSFLSHKDMELLLKGEAKAMYNLKTENLQKLQSTLSGWEPALCFTSRVLLPTVSNLNSAGGVIRFGTIYATSSV